VQKIGGMMTRFNEIDKDHPYRAKEIDTLSAVRMMGHEKRKNKETE